MNDISFNILLVTIKIPSMLENSYNYWASMSNLALSAITGNFIKHHRLNQNKTQGERIIEEIKMVVRNWQQYAEEVKVASSLRDSITKTLVVLK